MSIGILYYSHSTSRGESEFKSMPFYDASINHNRDKASEMSFKSNMKLSEADRIIYKDLTNNTTFGGQIVKLQKGLGGDYTYDAIDYTRLYQSKVTASFSRMTSSGILKSLLYRDPNHISTASIQNTTFIHTYLKWDNKSLWDIVEQLAWLEWKAGNYIYYDVDYAGRLIWKEIPKNEEGYLFTEAYEYDEEHDSSDIITKVVFQNSNKPSENLTVYANNAIAKWGIVSETVTCTPPAAKDKNKDKCKTTTTTKETYWSKCGLSPDKKLLVAIGKPSAGGEGKYPYSLHKTVFKNKCPHCGKATLIWGYQWGSGKVPCKGTYEGGSGEGHIFCTNCDADYGCLNGKEHVNGSNYYVKVVSKPVKSSQKEANTLKKGKLVYDKKNITKKKDCKKSKKETTAKSLKNEKNIKKYNIASSVWKKAVSLTSPKNSEMQNAKAIFKWMDAHLPYEGYSGTKYGAAGTLKRGKGNCCDHAHLFAAMCRSVGIKCNYIHNPCCGKGGHVYNKVYINGKGIIVDTGRDLASWGSHWGNSGCPTEKTSISF